ncbi:MAG: GAF and ANTAR domain-containing protein [Mycobacteriales bacterium]
MEPAIDDKALPPPEAPSTDALWAFAELGRIKLGDNTMEHVLNRVAELAKLALPHVQDVSVTLISRGRPTTAARTGDLARRLDESQYDAGYGPCLSAAKDQTTHLIDDMSTEERWPAFTADAVAAGALSSLSVGMTLHDEVAGALNIYADTRGAFGQPSIDLAQSFASYAGVTLTNASLYLASAALAEQLTQAMASRAVIEQAKGILVAQRHVSPDEAFAILSAASQAANRKLRDIAQAMVDGAASKANQHAASR